MIPTGLERVDFKFSTVSQELRAPTVPPKELMTSRCVIREGESFQASIPDCDATHREEEQDREELIWTPPAENYDNEGLQRVCEAARTQFPFRLETDRTLHAFMVNDYDVEKTLMNLEDELDSCTQKFLSWNKWQKEKWDKFWSSDKPEKQFRVMHQHWMRRHHLGEIISYYYRTKMNRNAIENKKAIARVECGNCTCLYRMNAILEEKMCEPCRLYKELYDGKRRPCPGNLSSGEMTLVKEWSELEMKERRTISIDEVRLHMEQKMRAKNRQNLTHDYWILAPKLPPRKENRNTANLCVKIEKEFDEDVKYALVVSITKNGRNFTKVAEEVGITEEDVREFYKRFKCVYFLDHLDYLQVDGSEKKNGYH